MSEGAKQHIFLSYKESHYIYVCRGHEEELYIPVHIEQVDQAIQQVTTAWKAMKIQTSSTRTGEIRDANLWLQVTGWTQYLQEFTTPSDFKILRAMVATLVHKGSAFIEVWSEVKPTAAAD
ncbi:hypothetical protein BDV23DRAFT_189689 [Aspergillus alliaceus]|uniref:Uncharacterized protein n=1 Tax=Petromyces alliaceus TaxID=209559 RepID=A0A5N7BQ52_PETAA|nr:hypothetical protein BDV23DRAFT_189689 [Aspergillus alliaceus]